MIIVESLSVSPKGQTSCIFIWLEVLIILEPMIRKGVSERSKHIDVKFHFVMKLKSPGETEFLHANLPEMSADIFTKDLSEEIYSRHTAAYAKSYLRRITTFYFQSYPNTFIMRQRSLISFGFLLTIFIYLHWFLISFCVLFLFSLELHSI